jgi:hypothetical protein
MSRRKAGRSSDAATVMHPGGHSTPPPGRDDESLLESPVIEGAQETDPPPPRPVSRARVGRSRNAHPHQFNDPSNYLG